jgi:hypothetical protein
LTEVTDWSGNDDEYPILPADITVFADLFFTREVITVMHQGFTQVVPWWVLTADRCLSRSVHIPQEPFPNIADGHHFTFGKAPGSIDQTHFHEWRMYLMHLVKRHYHPCEKAEQLASKVGVFFDNIVLQVDFVAQVSLYTVYAEKALAYCLQHWSVRFWIFWEAVYDCMSIQHLQRGLPVHSSTQGRPPALSLPTGTLAGPVQGSTSSNLAPPTSSQSFFLSGQKWQCMVCGDPTYVTKAHPKGVKPRFEGLSLQFTGGWFIPGDSVTLCFCFNGGKGCSSSSTCKY